MRNVKLGSCVSLDTKNCNKYIASADMLSGDEQRELTIWKKLSNHFLLGYFDDDTVLLKIVSKTKDEDSDEYENSGIFVPVDCIKGVIPGVESPIVLKLLEGVTSKEKYFKDCDDRINRNLEKIQELRNLKHKFYDYLKESVISALSSSFFVPDVEFTMEYTLKQLSYGCHWATFLVKMKESEGDTELMKFSTDLEGELFDYHKFAQNFRKSFYFRDNLISGELTEHGGIKLTMKFSEAERKEIRE